MRRLAIVMATAMLCMAQTAQQPGDKPADKPAESPVPAGEIALSGWVDLGYRWRSDISGSFDTYRSIVNLGSGPKLLGIDFTLTDPKRRLFDDLHVRAYGWGDDPYSTLHGDARKAKLYEITADYRNIAYFNALPSYADPLLTRGITLDEQSFDTRRRFVHFELTALPGNWFVPYAAYDRDAGSGTGVSTFVSNNNEFPVPQRLRDWTSNYRGGVRFELRRFHATLEQGGTRFEDNQTLYQNGGVNNGNSLTPVFGQTLELSNLLSAYGAHGSGVYTKALITANPTSWIDFYGQFLFSQPNTKVSYQQYDSGNLYLQSQVLFYTGQQYLVSSAARMPHTTGSAGVEIRPWQRLRITQSWLTDRMHNAGSSSQNQTLTAPQNQTEQLAALLSSSLASNYSQVEAMLYFDAASHLTLRGGYRYAWGDATDVTLPPEGLAASDRVRLRRNVGIGGFSYRPLNKLSLSAEVESGSSGGAYFRTSLYDYQKVRAQARYVAAATLSFSADFSLLNNQDPQPGIRYDYLAHQESLSAMWSPAAGKLFDLETSYSRSDLHADIGYLDPGTLQPLSSRYRDNSHVATALIRLNWPTGRIAPQLIAGGSLVISSGSAPTRYYQPMVKLTIPTGKHLAWFGEWRYYGYGEAFYLYEGFHAHVATAGMRYTR